MFFQLEPTGFPLAPGLLAAAIISRWFELIVKWRFFISNWAVVRHQSGLLSRPKLISSVIFKLIYALNSHPKISRDT